MLCKEMVSFTSTKKTAKTYFAGDRYSDLGKKEAKHNASAEGESRWSNARLKEALTKWNNLWSSTKSSRRAKELKR
jgi:hypothetical protein